MATVMIPIEDLWDVVEKSIHMEDYTPTVDVISVPRLDSTEKLYTLVE